MFDDFKFKVGDTVKHVTFSRMFPEVLCIIVARHLIQDETSSVSKYYDVKGVDGFCSLEAEFELIDAN